MFMLWKKYIKFIRVTGGFQCPIHCEKLREIHLLKETHFFSSSIPVKRICEFVVGNTGRKHIGGQQAAITSDRAGGGAR